MEENKKKEIQDIIERIGRLEKEAALYYGEAKEPIEYNIDKLKWQLEDLLKPIKEQVTEMEKEADEKIVNIEKEIGERIKRLEKEAALYYGEAKEPIEYNIDKLKWQLEADKKAILDELEADKKAIFDELEQLNVDLEEYGFKEPTKEEIEETKSEETKPEETKPEGTKPEETKPEGTKPTGTKPEETKPTGTKPEGTKPTGTKPTGTKPEETKSEETKPEETKPEETKPEETKPEETKPEGTKPTGTKPEGLQIKQIKIGEEIIIKYDTITLKERKLDFKQVKSNLEKTDEDKKKALNEIMGADIEWTEEQLDSVDYNMLSALKEARKDGVTKKTAKEILTSYMGAIAGKEEAKQKTKSILTYDRRGMDLLKPRNFFKYMARGVEYEKIKRNSDRAEEFSEMEVDEPGFFRKILYKTRQLKIDGKKVPKEIDKKRIKENMHEYYNGQKAQEKTKLRDREDIKVDDKVKDNIQNAVAQFYRDTNDPAYNVKMASKLRDASKKTGKDDNNYAKNDDDHEKARQAVEAYKKQNEEKEEVR